MKSDIPFSFLSCFAAGVFLGTCLLDLYPEVQTKLYSAVTLYISKDSKFACYPFGEAVMVAGFFLVLIVEQMVLALKEMSVESSTPANQNSQPGSSSQSKRVTYDSINSTTNEYAEHERLLRSNSRDNTQSRSRLGSLSSIRSIESRNNVHSQSDDQHEHSMHHDPSSHSPIRSLIMLAALSLHSVFEGLAVGLQDTEEGVLSIFGALILHKCIIAFSIGLNLVQSKLAVKAIIVSNAVFCFASPLGIAIGILITDFNSDADSSLLVNGILQGLACGTFLYVTFFEVLPHEFNKPKDRLLKLLFVIVGFAFVNGVLFLEMFLSKEPGCD